MDDSTESLLAALDRAEVQGPSRGGPYVGIQHNEVTRALMAKGRAIVPALTEKVRHGNLNATIFSIFLLRELKAKEARHDIEALNPSDRFRGVERDMTLEMQREFFLKQVDSW